MAQPWTEQHAAWEGTAGELVDLISALLPSLGWAADEPEPNVRLVRYYTQISVLDRPVRRGKEAIYGFRQLVQYLAARWLLLDGWLLAKIGEETSLRSTEALLALLPGGAPKNRAQSLIDRFRQDSLAPASPPAARPDPRAQAAWRTAQRARLQRALPALGNRSGSVPQRHVVMLELTPWCQVTVDADKASTLTDAEAAMLGEALAATLLDVNSKGGSR